ncbi:calcium-responsive transcription factor-like [Acropora muricata]|uniref:calcium-responsive transcription factor-like n=1 Tax=Acropora muricata TaxID=159855 RepID=UPI0034E45988
MVLQKKYELETTTKFSCYKSDKLFGSGDPFSKPRKIFFKDDRVPFDGIPFMTIGSKILDCQHGPDRKKNAKDKLSRQKEGIIHLKERGFCPKTLLSLAALQRSLCQKLYDLQVTRLQITQSDSDEACLIDLGLM